MLYFRTEIDLKYWQHVKSEASIWIYKSHPLKPDCQNVCHYKVKAAVFQLWDPEAWPDESDEQGLRWYLVAAQVLLATKQPPPPARCPSAVARQMSNEHSCFFTAHDFRHKHVSEHRPIIRNEMLVDSWQQAGYIRFSSLVHFKVLKINILIENGNDLQ